MSLTEGLRAEINYDYHLKCPIKAEQNPENSLRIWPKTLGPYGARNTQN